MTGIMADDRSGACRPPNSYFLDPPSDDEESFVVLGTSLPTTPSDLDSCVANETEHALLIDASAVEEALSLVKEHMSTMTSSNSSFPSMPKVSEQDLIPMVDKLHISAITTHSSVDLSPDEIQQKVDFLVEENIKLKETLKQNNLAMKNQYETLVLWQEDVMKVHQSHKEKFSETKKYIENLKCENAKLAQDLALHQSKSSSRKESIITVDCKSPAELISTNLIEFELETAQKKILALETEVKLLHNEKLTWENNYELQNTLTVQAENLQKVLDNCKQNHGLEVESYEKQLQQSESLQKILLDEIKMLKAKSVEHSKCVTREMLDNVQEQLMSAQMHITKLELLRNQDKELINEKEERIAKLEADINTTKDTMTALETQVELYKSDYHAEHQARTNLKADNEQIGSDLQQLQRRNNQLLEEVERLRGGDFVHVNRLEAAAATPSAPQDSPPMSMSYNCPLCMFRFQSLRLLEDHIEYCINNTA